MSLTRTLRSLEKKLDPFFHLVHVIFKSLFSLLILSIIAVAIWYAGPHLTVQHYAPLANEERRYYLILLVILGWLLKFIIIDLDIPNPIHYKNTELRKKCAALQNRFNGAMKFLAKTPVAKSVSKLKLSELPCYLLMGPRNAGKTTMLINSGIHYILQKQLHGRETYHPGTSENCDWWVTREACLIDVPGKYLSSSDAVDILSDGRDDSALWMFFLRMMRKKRGKYAVNGIILALPAAEIIQHMENKNYDGFIRDLFQRIQDVQHMFARPITCQLVITKCDLLPGFTEFFAENSIEETTQALGVTLPPPRKGENVTDIFTARFNTLIKNLNQQLLWRLHQERNPIARPIIKDFPLQIERIKEFAVDFIKKLSLIRLHVALRGVYLTSAIQPEPDAEDGIQIEPIETNAHVIQIFREPAATSRAYFIKQFFTQGINHENMAYSTLPVDRYKIHTAYAASVASVVLAAIIFGKDFQQGIMQTASIQQHFDEYQHRIAALQNPADQLISSIHLLNDLQPSAQVPASRFDLTWITNLYSRQSQKKSVESYQLALRNILIPEIKNYFEEYLANPVNKNAEDIYAVLKSYLMMGEAKYFDAEQITSTLQKIMPKTIKQKDSLALMQHLQTTFTVNRTPIALDAKKITEARKYLFGLPPLNLSYVILKNIDNNSHASNIRIDNGNVSPVIFANQHLLSKIPQMFTAKMFPQVLAKHTETAAREAYSGNWVLGYDFAIQSVMNTGLLEQLRIRYVSQYIETWENALENMRLSIPTDLAATDAMIGSIVSNDSPFLHLLKIIHDNTNLEPVLVASTKLQHINALVNKSEDSKKVLFTIFATMQSLHQYLQTILHAENIKQAAYDAVSNRMLNRGAPDAITQLRMIAENCPPPIRQWLVKITDNSWNYLMQEAGQYLDISWNTHVIPYYRAEIAGRYPFNSASNNEVSFSKFTQFFGSQGVVTDFYNKYLQRFVDTSTADWHWKQIDGKPVPFSVETLRQIQYAMRIHDAFFPNGDNKLYVQFALQPYKFGKMIKAVKIHLNDEQFMDNREDGGSHLVTLEGNHKSSVSSIQLVLASDKVLSRQYPGNWGWFKLLNQSFESVMTKRETLLNLSMNEHPAKYILTAEGRNPFLGLNFQLFHLPQQLTDEKA